MNKITNLSLGFLLASPFIYADTATPAPAAPKQGERLPSSAVSAYNMPARVTLKDKTFESIPDVFIEAAFTYWNVSEEGLDLASSAMFVANGPSSGYLSSATSNSTSLFQDAGYTPGFKVGIGGSCRDWTLEAMYTWVRQHTSTSKAAPTPSPDLGTAIWIPDNWFQQTTSLGQTIVATNLSSHWKVSMDLADVTVGRPYYVGRTLIASPFFGVRGAWIRQKLNIDITIPSSALATGSLSSASSDNNSNSWAVGPRVGCGANWLFPLGFKLEGSFAGSLLFTQYTHVTHSEQVAATGATPSTLGASFTNYNCVRPAVEVGAGLGWGTYFCGEACHVDLIASYDFMYFWNQNMMKKLMDQTVVGTSSTGDLELHGLTVTLKFDF